MHPVSLLTAVALLALTACPESPRDGAVTPTEAGDAVPSDKVAPAPGMGSAPAPGAVGEGPVDQPGRPPADVTFQFGDGGAVEVSGTVRYDGDADGTVRLDVLTLEEGQPPALAHTVQLDRPGGFELDVPKSYGDIHVVAFIDLAGDGPSPGDPAGAVSVDVGDEDLSGVEILISDEPDLGDLTPGAGTEGPPPPGDGEAPAAATTLHGDETTPAEDGAAPTAAGTEDPVPEPEAAPEAEAAPE